MQPSLFLVVTSLVIANTVNGDPSWVGVLKEFGFPIAAAIALWLRLERYQKDDRADRKASEEARLAILAKLQSNLETSQSDMKALARESIKAQNANAAAMRMMTRKLKTSAPCSTLPQDDA